MLLLLAAVAGCGGNGVQMGSVVGQVTLDGQPIKEAVISFTSDFTRSTRGKIINGEIVDLETFEPNDGVPVGKQRVTIRTAYAAAGNNDGTTPSYNTVPIVKIPPKYELLNTTPFEADIQRGKNELKFDLQSR